MEDDSERECEGGGGGREGVILKVFQETYIRGIIIVVRRMDKLFELSLVFYSLHPFNSCHCISQFSKLLKFCSQG